MKTVIKYIALIAAGILLYYILHGQATTKRGYEAIGGEGLFIGLPLWWALVRVTLRKERK